MNDRTRREVIRDALLVSAAGLIAGPATASDRSSSARVVLVRRPDVVDQLGGVQARVLGEMLDLAVGTLLDEPDARAAWRQVVAPTDTVGIKTNSWSHLPTPPELEATLEARVRSAGVAPDRVAVDDRGVRRNPVFAAATALINTRPMRTHSWSGLGTCLKNYIMFTPNPSDYHPDACADLGAVWKLPAVRGKTRLNVLVMLTPQFHSTGPHHFNRTYTWPYGGLIVSADPVAADTVGARIIAAKRRAHFGEDRPIAPPPHHIRYADERHGVGVSRWERIELVRLGADEDALI